MRKKIKVTVLMGGRSPEYEISLFSGKEVAKNLDRKKFDVYPVLISRDGSKWKYLPVKNLLLADRFLDLRKEKKELVIKGQKDISLDEQLIPGKIDLVFIAMHGPFGEDGTIQGMLDLAGIKYTGSGVLASALGMDKLMFRKVVSSIGICIPKYVSMGKGEKIPNLKKVIGDYPYFVKPVAQGSSVGSGIARNKSELSRAIDLAFSYGDTILIDEYVKGKEFTVAVLGNNNPFALPVVEIIPLKNEFFDYMSKYSGSGAREIVPARIPKSISNKIQKIAINVHKAVGCRGFSRVDFILNNKEPFLLEINTIPGLTPMSLVPKAAKAAGISYRSLLDKIIKYALEK